MASRHLARASAVLASTAAIAMLVCGAVFSVSPTAQANPATGFVAIDAGWSRSCGLTADGGVQCWGAIYGTTAVEVPGLASGATSISVGGAHACAVTAPGGAQCWGANAEGQLGDGTFAERLSPVDVAGLLGGVSAVAAGGFFTCARIEDGGAMCWGDNSQGQLGDGTSGNYRNTPADVSGLSETIVAIATGDDHACAITMSGGVMCWGSDASGQLGDGASGGLRTTPAPVNGLSSGVRTLALGADHSCAVLMSGAAKCWGGNASGQLGDGATSASATPVYVAGLSSGVAALAAGDGSTCTLTTAGGVKCWGANDYGQLGDGTTSERRMPVDVIGLTSGAANVTAGSAFACALKDGGGASCWGLNDSGQLGDGTMVQRLTPGDVVIEVKATPVPTPTLALLEGDANCDNRVDSIDAAVILQYGARLIYHVPCAGSADANDDGAIDSRDAALVLQYVAGLIIL